jgi:Bifunctional DNA primase/polymerase, N-terminal
MTTFKDRAQFGLDHGIPVIRVEAGGKNPYIEAPWVHGVSDATLDSELIDKWNAATPACNAGLVARAEIGGVWILETDSALPAKAYKEAIGKTFTRTWTIESNKGGHRYYRHNAASLAMGNIKQIKIDGIDWFSVRGDNMYCVSPGSIHPSGKEYKVVIDAEIVEAEPEMIEWLLTYKGQQVTEKMKSGKFDLASGEKIPHGQIYNYLEWAAGNLRRIGYTQPELEERLHELYIKNCDNPTPGHSKIHTVAEWVCGKQSAAVEFVEEPIKLASIEDVEVLGMPDDVVPDSRLGELFYEHMSADFPIDYGWIALIHAAGVLVPPTCAGGIMAGVDEDMTNFYTALVGPVNSGKSQATTWARRFIGITDTSTNYLEVKAGSAEGLWPRMYEKQTKGLLADQVMLDVDELSHLCKKIAIDKSSFGQVLTSGFYKRRQTLIIAGGKEVSLNCAMSWIGGVVGDEFEVCFGSSTTGGLYDRFMFGMCPTDYSFNYRQFPGTFTGSFTPIPVTVDPSVYEVTRHWKKENAAFTREVELGVRYAKVIASFDGRSTLYGKDMEGAPYAFAKEQAKIRAILKPNAGENPDAAFANAVIAWLKRHTTPRTWVPLRKVKNGLNVFRQKLGPNVIERAINSLVRQGEIEYRKEGKLIRLAVEEHS